MFAVIVHTVLLNCCQAANVTASYYIGHQIKVLTLKLTSIMLQ